MSRYALDENVLMLAQVDEDPQGNHDEACMELLVGIVTHSHGLILTEQIWRKYEHQVNLIMQSRRMATPRVFAQLGLIFTNSESDMLWLSDEDLIELTELDDLAGVDEGDRLFARAAATGAPARLVTWDQPFLTALSDANIPDNRGFTASLPPDALGELK